jgi:predicted nuclease of predicted toxin-antitoxin system
VKLLIDEMYSAVIAERLRDLGHDVISAQERDDLRSRPDHEIFQLMQAERQVIVTNNHRHFAPLVNAALQGGEPLVGVIFTADRSLPRNKATIPRMVALLDELLGRYHDGDILGMGIAWLAPHNQPLQSGS